MRLQDILLPLATGALAARYPSAGRGISAGLQGYLTIKEDERRQEERKQELALRERERAMQEQQFSMQLGEAVARADERERTKALGEFIGKTIGAKLPGVDFQRVIEEEGPAQQGESMGNITVWNAVDPEVRQMEEYRAIGREAGKMGFPHVALQYQQEARGIAEDMARAKREAGQDAASLERMREEFRLRDALAAKDASRYSGRVAATYPTDGGVAVVTEGGNIETKEVPGMRARGGGGPAMKADEAMARLAKVNEELSTIEAVNPTLKTPDRPQLQARIDSLLSERSYLNQVLAQYGGGSEQKMTAGSYADAMGLVRGKR